MGASKMTSNNSSNYGHFLTDNFPNLHHQQLSDIIKLLQEQLSDIKEQMKAFVIELRGFKIEVAQQFNFLAQQQQNTQQQLNQFINDQDHWNNDIIDIVQDLIDEMINQI